jgi:hypothetical protein
MGRHDGAERRQAEGAGPVGEQWIFGRRGGRLGHGDYLVVNVAVVMARSQCGG